MSCANQGLIISNLMKIHFFSSSLCSYEGYGSNSLALQEALKVTKYFMEKKMLNCEIHQFRFLGGNLLQKPIKTMSSLEKGALSVHLIWLTCFQFQKESERGGKQASRGFCILRKLPRLSHFFSPLFIPLCACTIISIICHGPFHLLPHLHAAGHMNITSEVPSKPPTPCLMQDPQPSKHCALEWKN